MIFSSVSRKRLAPTILSTGEQIKKWKWKIAIDALITCIEWFGFVFVPTNDDGMNDSSYELFAELNSGVWQNPKNHFEKWNVAPFIAIHDSAEIKTNGKNNE